MEDVQLTVPFEKAADIPTADARYSQAVLVLAMASIGQLRQAVEFNHQHTSRAANDELDILHAQDSNGAEQGSSYRIQCCSPPLRQQAAILKAEAKHPLAFLVVPH